MFEITAAGGAEGVGRIARVGAGVSHVKVGDRVLGNTGWGGMAQELALEASRLVPMPDTMPFDEAAAFIMTYGTSYHALKDRGHMKPGETLLVLGAGVAGLGVGWRLAQAGAEGIILERAQPGSGASFFSW